MAQRRVPASKLKRAIILYKIGNLGKSQVAKMLRMSRSTVKKYLSYFEKSGLHYTHITKLDDNQFLAAPLPAKEKKSISSRYSVLQKHFPLIMKRLEGEPTNPRSLWREYNSHYLDGYGYSQYVANFNSWLKDTGKTKPISPTTLLNLFFDKFS